MGRARYRTHYNELRRFALDVLPAVKLGPADRWAVSLEWSDGWTALVEKREADTLRLTCRVGAVPVQYYVGIATSARHFGGAQRYLVCPHCRRRCRVMRLVTAEFRCQRCIGALYKSQSLGAADRALHRYRTLRARVQPGTEDCHVSWFPRRPKRMRRTTYQRIKAQAWAALARYDELDDVRLYRLWNRLAPNFGGG